MTRIRRWFWPLSLWYVVIPAIMVAAIVTAGTVQMVTWPYLHWTGVSTEWHQRFQFAGPVAAAAAALWAARLNRPSHAWTHPHASRLGGVVVTRHLGMLLVALVGAYVLAMLPVTIATAVSGGAGSPNLLVMISGPLAMCAAVAIGYALGTLAPSLVTVPLVGIAAVGLEVVTEYGVMRGVAVAPRFYIEPYIGEHESLALAVFRVLVFTGAALTAAGVAAVVLRWIAHGRQRTVGMAASVVAFLAPVAVLAGMGLANPPAMYVADGNTDRVCTSERGVQYCVHPDNAERLDEMVAAFDAVLERYGSEPTTFTDVWDYGLIGPQGSYPGSALVAYLEPSGVVDVESSQVYDRLSGFAQCPASGSDPETTGLYIGLDNYLRSGKASASFAGMSTEEIQTWISDHQRKLATCSLDGDDEPA